jgi:CcmD family protein
MKNFDSIFAAYLLGWAVFFGYYLSIGKRVSSLLAEIEQLKNSVGRGK